MRTPLVQSLTFNSSTVTYYAMVLFSLISTTLGLCIHLAGTIFGLVSQIEAASAASLYSAQPF